MDRQERLTTFSAYPDPPLADPAGMGFSTDLHPALQNATTAAPPPSRYAGLAWKAAGVSLRLLEALMHSTIRVEGVQNVAPGPVLFVANHFTRFETFILPYVINGHLHRRVHSLAFHKLFRGRFGDLLMSVGARPTGDPVVKHTIIEDLMTGRHDWLIYPEGSMVKNKKIWAKGHYQLDIPDRVGMPHSGAAIMALKTMIYRKLYRQAIEQNNSELMKRYENRYHLSGPSDIDVPDLQIVPVNITYYPIRPGKNIVHRLARWMFRQLPSVLEEELVLEGSLLFGETDISVYFGKPLSVDHYLQLLMPTLQQEMPFVDQLRRANHIMGAVKNRLTRHMVHEIYTRLTINFDHLFCSGLRATLTDTIKKEDFHQALYLATRHMQIDGKRRSHPSISRNLIDLMCGLPYEPLASVEKLATEEGIISSGNSSANDTYHINRDVLNNEHNFHDVRLKNTVSVIANELEPMRKAIRLLRNAMKMSPTVRKREVATLLMHEEMAEYQDERQQMALSPSLKPEAIGKPIFLHHANSAVGIVLSHGYLAAPAEVLLLGQYLYRLGFSVYLPRLRGHGTAPEQLAFVTAEDWQRSYLRAVTIMKNTCQHVIVGGFSMGGLLALDAAALHPSVMGCFSISPCLKLMDPAARMVPAVVTWNHIMESIHLPGATYRHFDNNPENPETNYPVNYLAGVHQLERLIERVNQHIPHIITPTLVVQADHDPVVNPTGAQDIISRIRSDEKELALMSSNRHVIVRGDISSLVCERIGEFVRRLANRVGKNPEHQSSEIRRSARDLTDYYR
jgi:esterase/lipase/1-acyl-sn-glycerol-3-phosphate acyltransferase